MTMSTSTSTSMSHHPPSPPLNSYDLGPGTDIISDIMSMPESLAWGASFTKKPYLSPLIREIKNRDQLLRYVKKLSSSSDPLWYQIRLEAKDAVFREPKSGPNIYSSVLFHDSLISAVIELISQKCATELIPATEFSNLMSTILTRSDRLSIVFDIMAPPFRSPAIGTCLDCLLYSDGFHALVLYRVSHRLWKLGRKSLAFYLQSLMSSRFSADVHPAATLGSGIFLNIGVGVVIGETAVVGDDVTILQGVTLGGTGKTKNKDRHPKIGRGVILQDDVTILGNIKVGDLAVVTAKSMVLKNVPRMARMRGIPAKEVGYRGISPPPPNEIDTNGLDRLDRMEYEREMVWLEFLIDTEKWYGGSDWLAANEIGEEEGALLFKEIENSFTHYTVSILE